MTCSLGGCLATTCTYMQVVSDVEQLLCSFLVIMYALVKSDIYRSARHIIISLCAFGTYTCTYPPGACACVSMVGHFLLLLTNCACVDIHT